LNIEKYDHEMRAVKEMLIVGSSRVIQDNEGNNVCETAKKNMDNLNKMIE